MQSKKGQIFSLDYAISLIIIFLAIGMAINFFELQAINAKEEFAKQQIQNIGKSASRLMISSPDIVCELVNEKGKRLDFIANCIGGTDRSRLTKQNLGIPNNYDCNINSAFNNSSFQTILAYSGCTTNIPANALNVFSETRIIAIRPDEYRVSKKELVSCILGQPCILDFNTLTINVWRT